jgi:predicted RNase H-like HicB family nuclease
MVLTEKRKFTIIIQDEPEGGYTGRCLELKGAISYGKTIDELKKNMKEAISLVLETLNEQTQTKRKEIIEIS